MAILRVASINIRLEDGRAGVVAPYARSEGEEARSAVRCVGKGSSRTVASEYADTLSWYGSCWYVSCKTWGTDCMIMQEEGKESWSKLEQHGRTRKEHQQRSGRAIPRAFHASTSAPTNAATASRRQPRRRVSDHTFHDELPHRARAGSRLGRRRAGCHHHRSLGCSRRPTTT